MRFAPTQLVARTITTPVCLGIYRLSSAELPAPLKNARNTLVRVLRRSGLPQVRLTVRVEAGLARGLWIRARFPGEAAYWRGQREASTERAIRAVVGDGTVVYDVGAHIGTVALGTARLTGEKGRVVAFEPDPESAASLRESSRLNGLEGRVQVVEAAVWSSTNPDIAFRRGSSRLSHGGVDADDNTPVRADGPSIRVPSITLDDFIASGGPPPELVKIDVEGAEFEVLRGGTRLFSCNRPCVAIEVHHSRACRLISSWMQERGYQGRWFVPENGFPRLLFAWPAESPLAGC